MTFKMRFWTYTTDAIMGYDFAHLGREVIHFACAMGMAASGCGHCISTMFAGIVILATPQPHVRNLHPEAAVL